jgi:hypothetical protein
VGILFSGLGTVLCLDAITQFPHYAARRNGFFDYASSMLRSE